MKVEKKSYLDFDKKLQLFNELECWEWKNEILGVMLDIYEKDLQKVKFGTDLI